MGRRGAGRKNEKRPRRFGLLAGVRLHTSPGASRRERERRRWRPSRDLGGSVRRRRAEPFPLPSQHPPSFLSHASSPFRKSLGPAREDGGGRRRRRRQQWLRRLLGGGRARGVRPQRRTGGDWLAASGGGG